MKQIILLVIAAILFIPCRGINLAKDSANTWADARWIAYQKLEDSLIVIPAIYPSTVNLGNKCKSRSIVPMFRKKFDVNNNIEKVSINICGLGHYELYINGNKVGNRFLSPGWSYYQKRCLYNSFDITKLIKNGNNAIGVIVGNGFYNINSERYRKLEVAYGYPKLIFNIIIKYTDGSIKNIVSDNNCKVTPSPITFSSIYGGEDYDATMEQMGWNTTEFDDSKWNMPVIINDNLEKLMLEEDYPLNIMKEIKAKQVIKSKTGRTIYDFGQNASAIISLKVKGNKGAQIRIRPDELVNDQFNITQASSGKPYEFNYILKGEGEEEWQPRFTYYGFRYADVEIIEPKDADNKTDIIELKMLHTSNSLPVVGSFSCSNPLFNQIFDLINWSIKSNLASVTTDCPHREKLGWLEQTHLMGPSIHYNFDIHTLYNKIVTDMIDSQLDNGLIPDIAPEYIPFDEGFRYSPEWGSAGVIIPWQIYKWYGDKEVLAKAYPMIKRYIEYLKNKLQNKILDYGLGDWYDLGPNHPGYAQLTPRALTATSIYYYDLQIAAQIANIMGYNDDFGKYNKLSGKIKDAFLKKFYNSKTGICSTGSQTSYAMSLYTGIIPKEDKELVLNNLVKSIADNDYALTAGDIGYHYLVCVLSDNGKSDVLYKMNNRSDRPGYGYQLKKGATSLTESWTALTDASNNHMMLGHLMEWLYAGLGGIYQEEFSIAYSDIIIAPKPVGDIKWVKCSYISIKGVISSEWELKDKTLTLNIEIPKNTSAKIIIPEEYKNATIKVIDSITQKQIDPKILNGAIKVNSGSYTIIAK